jgi:four helix bundle protein
MKIERFEDIEAWRAARALASDVYELARTTELKRDFGLRDQMQRTVVSIMANIAEGFDSRSNQEFLRFLGYAYRSATELQSHLYVAMDQAYLDEEGFDKLCQQATKVHRLLNGFIRYLKEGKERGHRLGRRSGISDPEIG